MSPAICSNILWHELVHSVPVALELAQAKELLPDGGREVIRRHDADDLGALPRRRGIPAQARLLIEPRQLETLLERLHRSLELLLRRPLGGVASSAMPRFPELRPRVAAVILFLVPDRPVSWKRLRRQ